MLCFLSSNSAYTTMPLVAALVISALPSACYATVSRSGDARRVYRTVHGIRVRPISVRRHAPEGGPDGQTDNLN
jgi:hypothetical protein